MIRGIIIGAVLITIWFGAMRLMTDQAGQIRSAAAEALVVPVNCTTVWGYAPVKA